MKRITQTKEGIYRNPTLHPPVFSVKKERASDKTDLYFIQSKGTGYLKIGRANDCERRLKELQTGNALELRIIHVFKGMAWREYELHKLLAQWRLEGEWFHPRCIGSIPVDMYEQIPWGALYDWWEEKK